MGYASSTVWLQALFTCLSFCLLHGSFYYLVQVENTMGVGDTDTALKATRFQSKTKQSNSEPGLNSKAFQLLQENKSVFLLKSCSYGISFLYTCYLYFLFFLLHLWNVGTTEEKYINGEKPVKIITEFQLYKLKISSGQLLKQGNTTCKTSAACVDTYLWTFLQLKAKSIIMSKCSHTQLLFLNFFSLVFQHLIQLWSPVFTIMGQWSQEQNGLVLI